jgi:acyl-CoA reductase-like NAD-dependent aldehyde dehydrogenase
LTSTSKTRRSPNPATGEPNLEAPVSTAQDLDKAVEAARKAGKAWARTTFDDRCQRILAYADALETYREEFVQLLIAEQGKFQPLANDEFDRTLKMVRTTPTLKLDEEVVEDGPEKRATVRYVPIGVTCGLVPWNYPLLLAMGKMIPAVYAGNTIIMKPSPDTPYGGLKLVELANQFFPPGVIQGLAGGHELGPMFTSHPGIDKVSFTGSIATGKAVMADCAKTLKRVTLELGGNDAAIICEDVDIEKTAPAVSL